MRYYLVAGEASGDLHGASLMKALKTKDADARFRYFGGDRMEAEGGELVRHYSEMAFMGFVEVIVHLRTISRNLRSCREDIIAWKPAVLVLIDFPGFNLRIAAAAKAAGILVCYYISPKVWAWNQKRVLKIRRVVDHLFCILPFEVDFYRQWDMKVDYVGNPVLDAIAAFRPRENFRGRHGLSDAPIVALLPGSRRQEISRLLPKMSAVAARWPAYQFVVAAAPNFDLGFYRNYMGAWPIGIVFDETYDLLSHASAAVVASGTATLETALFRVPQVVVYRGNPLSIAIARAVVRVKWISLVNLIVNRTIVTELIQEDYSLEKVHAELERILENRSSRSRMLKDYEELGRIMGAPGASERTAHLILAYSRKR